MVNEVFEIKGVWYSEIARWIRAKIRHQKCYLYTHIEWFFADERFGTRMYRLCYR
jgi:hypothetical protein